MRPLRGGAIATGSLKAKVDPVHPCIGEAIHLAVAAVRRRSLASCAPEEVDRFGLESSAEILSGQAARTLGQLFAKKDGWS